jgi:hypothetical protein
VNHRAAAMMASYFDIVFARKRTATSGRKAAARICRSPLSESANRHVGAVTAFLAALPDRGVTERERNA